MLRRLRAVRYKVMGLTMSRKVCAGDYSHLAVPEMRHQTTMPSHMYKHVHTNMSTHDMHYHVSDNVRNTKAC